MVILVCVLIVAGKIENHIEVDKIKNNKDTYYAEIKRALDITMDSSFRYSVEITGTLEEEDKPNKVDAYEANILGVNSKELKVEYRDREKEKIVTAVEYNGKKYINDGVYEIEGQVYDNGIGLNRTSVLKNVWYDIINMAVDLEYNVEKTEVDGYIVYNLKTRNADKIAEIVGYSNYSDEQSRELSVEVEIVEDVIKDVNIVVEIVREFGKEVHIQHMGNKERLTEEIELGDYGLRVNKNGEIIRKGKGLVDKIEENDEGLPRGSTNSAVLTATGAMAIGVDIDHTFIDESTTNKREVDGIYVAKAKLTDTDSIEIHYNKDYKLLGFDFTGEYIIYEMSYKKGYNELDPYRLVTGFVRNEELTTNTRAVYEGLIGEDLYVMVVKYDNGIDVSSGIMVMKKDMYEKEYKN